MIVASEGSDTALARLLLSQASLDVETLRGALRFVRQERDQTGLTLAQVLRERQLVPPPVLEQALQSLSARQATAGTSPLPVLPDHRVVRELARGGMGVVYEVERISDGAHFALKTLLPGALTLDPEGAEAERIRFVREAEALAQLRHPHVVRIHGADLEGRVPYMIQDLLPGGTLAERLRQGPLPWQEAIEITTKLSGGLAHAHARGLLHRDLKPLNVIFDDQGEPRLVDFGLVRSLAGSNLTQTGQLLGTPAYMAPEQAFGQEADVRTDVYGMGAVLYALLTGRPPFEGSGLGILAAVAEDRPPPMSSLEVEVPSWLEAACLRALEKDPADRYASLELLQQALESRSEALPKRKRFPWGWLAALVALGAAVPGALAFGSWQAERSRLQAQAQALEELRQALQTSVAHVHSGLPAWSRRWPHDPPAELTLARGLSALVAGDLTAAEDSARQLGAPETPQGFREALLGGIAVASSGRSAAGIKSLRLARDHLALRDLQTWEIELLLRSSQDSDRAAALALLAKRLMPDPAARPTPEEVRLALRAVLAFKREPSSYTLERMERLLPGLEALEAWRVCQGLSGQIDRDEQLLTKRALRAPELAPPFLRSSLEGLARGWQIQLTQRLRERGESDHWVSLPAELYRRLAAWLQIARRLGVQGELRGLIEEVLQHARDIGPIRVNLGGRDLTEQDHHESVRARAAQAGFLTQLILTRPRDPGLRRAALRLISALPARVRVTYRPCLGALLAEASPEERPWIEIYDCYVRVDAETDPAGCLTALEPYLSWSDLGRDPPPTVIPLTRHDLRALLLWSLARANALLERVDPALLHYRSLGSLPLELQGTVSPWRSDQLQLQCAKAEADHPPGASRDRALRAVALSSLRQSQAAQGRLFHLQHLLGPAWSGRHRLTTAERRELIDAMSPFRETRFFSWIMRRAALLAEEGRCEEAAHELRFSYSLEGLERLPSKDLLAESREVADQAERAQTPAERDEVAARILTLVRKKLAEEGG